MAVRNAILVCTVVVLSPWLCSVADCSGQVANGTVRLAYQPYGQAHTGIVQIFYNGQWAEMCRSYYPKAWSIKEANVVCRQLGFPRAIKALDSYDSFDFRYSRVRFDVACNGTEATLTQCSYTIDEYGYCILSSSSSPGVECEPFVRIVQKSAGQLNSTGRVQAFHNGTWGNIASSSKMISEAQLACHQLGFFRALNITFESTASPTPVYNLNGQCENLTSTNRCVRDVNSTWSGSYLSTIQCDPSVVQLAGDPNGFKWKGRVEVRTKGQWVRVCGLTGWTLTEANVICRDLGYPAASRLLTYYGGGSGHIYLRDVRCTGNESNILQCAHIAEEQYGCPHEFDVGLQCEVTRIIPYSSNHTNIGEVEVFQNGKWGKICADHWTAKEANVVCLQLGYTGAIRGVSRLGAANRTIFLGDINCMGTESSLQLCTSHTHKCSSLQNAGVECAKTDTRIADGLAYIGRVDLWVDFRWSGICARSGSWTLAEANIVCQGIGYQRATRVIPDWTVRSTSAITLQNLQCKGDETSLTQCNYWAPRRGCGPASAGVECEVLRLRPYSSTQSNIGELEVFENGRWGNICANRWTLTEANVICRQLLYPRAIQAIRQPGGQNRSLTEVNCIGNERSLLECSYQQSGNNTCSTPLNAGVDCADLPVRLMDGSFLAYSRGTVEVRNHLGSWGTVCSPSWSILEANVVCKQLGFIGANATITGIGRHIAVNINHPKCNGTEKSLFECSISSSSFCPYWFDSVGVDCDTTASRIVGDPLTPGYGGQVEVDGNGQWMSVCASNWTLAQASAVCRNLKYAGVYSVTSQKQITSNYSLVLDNLHCDGNETNLLHCSHDGVVNRTCPDFKLATVECRTIEISVPPESVIANQGSNVSLTCSAHGKPAPQIAWTFNGTPLAPALYSVNTEPNSLAQYSSKYISSSTLAITDVSFNASLGNYSCIASNNVSTHESSAQATITVHVLPVGLAQNAHQAVTTGQQVNMTVLLTDYGYPAVPLWNITWAKDGDPYWKSLSPGHVLSRNNLSLVILRAQFSDSGTYVARLGNLAGYIHVKFNISVQDLPVGRALNAVQTVQIKQPVNMTVVLTYSGKPSVPSLNILWTKVGDPDWSSLSAEYLLSSNKLSLSILHAQISDSGTYVVRLGNLAGRIDVKFNISVEGSPQVLLYPSTKTTMVNENGTLTLQCIATGYPLPQVRWLFNSISYPTPQYHNTEYINNNSEIRATGLPAVVSNLTISAVHRQLHEGLYTCVASNLRNVNVSASATVVIYVPATLLGATLDQSVAAGNTAELQCHVNGYPRPTTTWYKNGLILEQDDLIGRVSFYKGDDILTIYNTQVSDSDAYHCVASNMNNDVGATVHGNYAQLTVTVTPVIDPPVPDTMTSFTGSSLSVPCTFTGSPQAEARWCRQQNGECTVDSTGNCPALATVEASNNTLTLEILSLDSCHGGSYMCIVNNSIGKTASHLQLTIQDVASIGLRGEFSGGGLSGLQNAEVRTLFENEVLNKLLLRVKIEHFTYIFVGSNIINVTCDITTSATDIAQISGNSSEANLLAAFEASLQATQSPKLSLVSHSLTVIAYDVCSPEVTTGRDRRGSFYWPETYSNATLVLDCPVELQDGIIRYASRQCITMPRPHNPQLVTAQWEMANATSCPTPRTAQLQQIAKIDFNSSDPEHVLNGTLTLDTLTNNTETLTTDDIDFASTAIFNVINAVSKDQDFNQTVGKQVALSILHVVDNVLTVKGNNTAVAPVPAKRLAKSMERLVTTLDVSEDEPIVKTENNIGFAVSCPRPNGAKQAFRSVSQNRDGMFYVGELNSSALASAAGVAFDISGKIIRAATDMLTPSNDSVCTAAATRYILYRTHALFDDSNISATTSVASEVISAQVGNAKIDGLTEPVLMSFDFKGGIQADKDDTVQCAFWNFDQNDGKGGWSEDGCITFYNSTTGNRPICQCNHLTNFAVLFTRVVSPHTSKAQEALKYVSIVGCAISMAALVATIITIALVKRVRKNLHHRMILGLSITLLLFLAIFTVVLYYENLQKSPAVCKTLAIILHYLLLCAFMWMSVDAVFMYKQIVVVFDNSSQHLKTLLFWSIFVIPFVIVAITTGASTSDGYGGNGLCWISMDAVFYAGLVVPMALSLLLNGSILVRVAVTLRGRGRKVSTVAQGEHRKNFPVLSIVVLLSVLLGLTWLFGFLVIIDDNIALQYIFTILNSLQGLGIFIHIIRGKEMRKGLKEIQRMPTAWTNLTTGNTSTLRTSTLGKSAPGNTSTLTSNTSNSLPRTIAEKQPATHATTPDRSDLSLSLDKSHDGTSTQNEGATVSPDEFSNWNPYTPSPLAADKPLMSSTSADTSEELELKNLAEGQPLTHPPNVTFQGGRAASKLKFKFQPYQSAEARLDASYLIENTACEDD